MSRPVPRGHDKVRECVAIGECRPPAKSKKDTKRWCGGKPGRTHRFAWVVRDSLPNSTRVPGRDWDWRIENAGHVTEQLVCLTCGQQPWTRTSTGGYGGMRHRCLNCGDADGWDHHDVWKTYETKKGRRRYPGREYSCRGCGQVKNKACGTIWVDQPFTTEAM